MSILIKLSRLCNIHLILGLACILMLMQTMQSLLRKWEIYLFVISLCAKANCTCCIVMPSLHSKVMHFDLFMGYYDWTINKQLIWNGLLIITLILLSILHLFERMKNLWVHWGAIWMLHVRKITFAHMVFNLWRLNANVISDLF